MKPFARFMIWAMQHSHALAGAKKAGIDRSKIYILPMPGDDESKYPKDLKTFTQLLEAGKITAHTTKRTIDEGTVSLIWTIGQCRIDNLAREPPKRSKDEGHVFVALAVIGREVLAPQRGNGKRMVFED